MKTRLNGMKVEQIDTIEISARFMPALIEKDYTGLNDKELELVKAYADKVAGCILEVVDGWPEFNRCDVCGRVVGTYTVEVWREESQ